VIRILPDSCPVQIKLLSDAQIHIESIFNDLLEHVARKRELVEEEETAKNRLDTLMANFDDIVFKLKKRCDSLQRQVFTNEQHRSVSEVSSSSTSTKSLSKINAKVSMLEAERSALLSAQEDEIRSETIRVEEESELATRITKAKQQRNLLRMEEIAKIKAMEKMYREEEKLQGDGHASDTRSNVSHVSCRSSVVKRAELAGLNAELSAKRKTQEAELNLEKLKFLSKEMLAKKVQQQKRHSQLLQLESKIVKEKEALKDKCSDRSLSNKKKKKYCNSF